ncbi:hypothetical protein FHX08_003415 [Rhizobium sp. BK529]|nr:hypothetical protein [Rhizobium sp. BK529]TCS07452.1 hypothetical protein EV281_1021071 [Rhizobium sp. BK418]
MVARVSHATKDFAYAAEPKITAPARVNAAEYPGSAPYICSPSGSARSRAVSPAHP